MHPAPRLHLHGENEKFAPGMAPAGRKMGTFRIFKSLWRPRTRSADTTEKTERGMRIGLGVSSPGHPSRFAFGMPSANPHPLFCFFMLLAIRVRGYIGVTAGATSIARVFLRGRVQTLTYVQPVQVRHTLSWMFGENIFRLANILGVAKR